MSKAIRQYISIFAAAITYYIVHEGAHLLYALLTGVFRKINIMGLGVQIDVYAESMSDIGMALFCVAGAGATTAAAYLLVRLAGRITKNTSKLFMACMYYVTMAMLFIDPVYLSILCGFFGGGDMNGISLVIPQAAARAIFGVLLAVNIAVFIKQVLPFYKSAFSEIPE